jgi:Sodium:alanine symporter family
MDQLAERVLAVNDFVWQPLAMPIILLPIGAWLTPHTGFVQIARFRVALRMVMQGAFARDEGDGKTITPFKALSTAPAATVGNGNIGGGATAILSRGLHAADLGRVGRIGTAGVGTGDAAERLHGVPDPDRSPLPWRHHGQAHGRLFLRETRVRHP